MISGYSKKAMSIDGYMEVIFLTGGKCVFSILKTGNSTLPPIINAIEIYTVKDLSQSETDQQDGMLLCTKKYL